MRRSIGLSLLILLVLGTVALGCPNCREAVANQSAEAAGQAHGFAWSILFMISMPFLLLTIGCCTLVSYFRRGLLPEL